MKALNICIPDGLEFGDLKLSRDPATGEVEFDWGPVERICEASGIDIAVFRDSPEDNIAALFVAWYRVHLADGGALDPVQEQLLAEVQAEDAFGFAAVQTGGGGRH